MTFFAARTIGIAFGGHKAVDGVDFEVREGEVLALVGPNGAGKTTIFNLISRIYNPTQGSLIFRNQDITRVPAHRIARLGIARTFQNIELFENATLLRNLLAGRHVHARSNLIFDGLYLPKVRRTERMHRQKVEDIIDFLDLQAYRDQAIKTLPYGVRKVAEIARALCTEPRLLLLDEPSSGLNPEETEDLAFWIHDINRIRGITIILVEHDMRLVNEVSDSVVAINSGRVLAKGTPKEVLSNPEVVSAYLGS